MSYKDENWEERVAILGDPSEKAFQEYAERRALGCVKYGLDRPPVDLGRIPAYVRYTPDFLTDEGLVEVQGCGKDQMFKFKHEKIRALTQWNRNCGVMVWLWNQPLEDWRMISVPRLFAMCRHSGYGQRTVFRVDGVFDGNKEYSAVPWVDLI